jgi:hypothetical protein
MGNLEWNSGITKEMGNQTFKESSQVLSSSLQESSRKLLQILPTNTKGSPLNRLIQETKKIKVQNSYKNSRMNSSMNSVRVNSDR